MNITTEERDYLIHAPKMILKKPRKLGSSPVSVGENLVSTVSQAA